MLYHVFIFCITSVLFSNNLVAMQAPAAPAPEDETSAKCDSKKPKSDEKIEVGTEVDAEGLIKIEKGGPASEATVKTMREALAAFGVTTPCDIETCKGKLVASLLYPRPGCERKVVLYFNEEPLNRKIGHLAWVCYYYAAGIFLWENGHSSFEDSVSLACDMLIAKKGKEGFIPICIGIVEALRDIHEQQKKQLELKMMLTKLDEQGCRFDFVFKPGFDYLEICMGVQRGSPDDTIILNSNYPGLSGFDQIKKLLIFGENIKIGSWNVSVGKKAFLTTQQWDAMQLQMRLGKVKIADA